MLQYVVLALIRIITSTFFRRIDVAGQDRIPGHGPVIFAGNHPNALMDGWLLTARCGRRPLRFLANAGLWKYRLLGIALDACGAIPVQRREDHGDAVDNNAAFSRLFEALEAGDCVGIFPEGISHAEPQLSRLKTGTARIALGTAARGKVSPVIVPCGLNYVHRHRFRSQVFIEFGAPIVMDEARLAAYRANPQEAVRELTDELGRALAAVTLNAPDWRTLRIIQTARRLYKPTGAELTPAEYVELNRRFVRQYVAEIDRPDMQALGRDLENYQARLDLLGIRDHQLRRPVDAGQTMRTIVGRGLRTLILLPLAVPGAILHLPVGWIAAAVGERFSYELDDVATLKVLATILLLPVLYLLLALWAGFTFGFVWAVIAVVALVFSFFASVRLIEAEANLLLSMVSLLRLARLRSDVEELRATRAALVAEIRAQVASRVDPSMQRIFTDRDFAAETDT